MIELLNIDCMEYMKGCEDNQFDLAIVDPPYGIGEDGSNNKSRIKLAKPQDYKGFHGGDREPPKPDYFDQLKRISKNQIIFGANHFIDNFPFMCNSSCWIVFDKDNSGDFADCELAWTSFKTSVRKFKYTWNGMLQGDMKNKQSRIHPTEKPIKLYEWLLTNYAKEGDKILDTHGGSMSSAIACHNLGFDLVLTELDEDYYKAGVERFEQHKKQLRMF